MVGEVQSRRARQLVIVLLLRARGKLRAPELGAMLGVSARTIARDCADLELLGVPVQAERGALGGLSLPSPFAIEPARFITTTSPQARRGRSDMEPSHDSASAALNALERLRLDVRVLLERIDLRYRTDVEAVLGELDARVPSGEPVVDAGVLLALRRALWQGRRVRLVYPTRGKPRSRDVDPLVLLAREDIWYLAGFCHWRKDVRAFVVSRISEAALLDDTAPAARQVQIAGDALPERIPGAQ